MDRQSVEARVAGPGEIDIADRLNGLASEARLIALAARGLEIEGAPLEAAALGLEERLRELSEEVTSPSCLCVR